MKEDALDKQFRTQVSGLDQVAPDGWSRGASWDKVQARLHPEKKKRVVWWWWTAAASILILLGISLWQAGTSKVDQPAVTAKTKETPRLQPEQQVAVEPLATKEQDQPTLPDPAASTILAHQEKQLPKTDSASGDVLVNEHPVDPEPVAFDEPTPLPTEVPREAPVLETAEVATTVISIPEEEEPEQVSDVKISIPFTGWANAGRKKHQKKKWRWPQWLGRPDLLDQLPEDGVETAPLAIKTTIPI